MHGHDQRDFPGTVIGGGHVFIPGILDAIHYYIPMLRQSLRVYLRVIAVLIDHHI
jgi:hypothetical protein